MELRTLTDKEMNLLLHCLKQHAPELLSEVDRLDQLDIDRINDMRDAIGDELQDKGIDGEVNEYGLELEELIGRLADLYIWPKGYAK